MARDAGQILRQVLREADGSLSVISAGSSTAQILLMVLDSVNSALRVNMVFGGAGEDNKVVVTDSNGNLETSDITTTELDYLNGVSSNIQDQINALGGSSANEISFTPDGDIAATNVQDAIEEVRDDTDTKLSAKADSSDLADYVAKSGDASTLLLMHLSENLNCALGKSSFLYTGIPLIVPENELGTGSLYLNGASFIEFLNLNFENFEDNPFTIDFWIRPGSFAAWTDFFGNWDSNDSDLGWMVGWDTDAKLVFTYTTDGANGTQAVVTWTTETLTLNTWQHIAIVRDKTANIIRMFKNGTEATSSNTSIATGVSIYSPTANLPKLGARSGQTAYYYTGHIQELRVSNIARWTENFTAPTSPY